MEAFYKQIGTLFLFENIPPPQLPDALKTAEAVLLRCRAGEVILPRGDAPALFCILEGAVSVSRCTAHRTMPLNRLGPGDVFGAAQLFCESGEPFPTTVKTTRQSVLLCIPEAGLRAYLRSNVPAALAYISYLSCKIRFLNRKLDACSGRDAEGKVALCLLRLSEGDTVSTGTLNMKALAASLDIGRASLYRILSRLEQAGAITREKDLVHIQNKTYLERLV